MVRLSVLRFDIAYFSDDKIFCVIYAVATRAQSVMSVFSVF